MTFHREVLRKSFSVSAGTFISRITGLVRDMVTARFFGTSAAMDIFGLAFMVPNLFRAFFGEGALNVAFVPTFTREGLASGGDARRLLNAVMTALAALLMVITAAGWLVCAGMLLWGNPPAETRHFCILLAIMLPYLPLICLTALQSGALNVRGHFLIPAVTPTLMNLCWIAAAWLYGDRIGVQALAWSVLVSGVLQFGAQAWMLRHAGLAFRVVWDLAHPGLRKVVRLTMPVVFGLSVVQVNVLVDRLIAQFLVPGSGANSALFYGGHLMQFPLGVLGIALATAAFPVLAHIAAQGDRAGLAGAVNSSVRTALFVSLPCVAVMMALSGPIVRALYERGAFDAESTARTARVLYHYSLGLWALCSVQVLARGFQATLDTRTPALIAAAAVAFKVAINFVLVWPMREAGLALASSLSNIANALLLAIFLRRAIGPIGGRSILVCFIKSSAAALAGGAAGYAVALALGIAQPVPGMGDIQQVLRLAASLTAAGATFLVAAWILRVHEMREFIQAVVARRRGTRG